MIQGYHNIFKDKYTNDGGKQDLASEIVYYTDLWFPDEAHPRGNFRICYEKFLELFAKVKGPSDLECISTQFLINMSLNSEVLAAFLSAAPLWALESLKAKLTTTDLLKWIQVYLNQNEVLDADLMGPKSHGWQLELIPLLDSKEANTSGSKFPADATKHFVEVFEKTYIRGKKFAQVSKIELLESVVPSNQASALSELTQAGVAHKEAVGILVAKILSRTVENIDVVTRALYKYKVILQAGKLVQGVTFTDVELDALEELRLSGALDTLKNLGVAKLLESITKPTSDATTAVQLGYAERSIKELSERLLAPKANSSAVNRLITVPASPELAKAGFGLEIFGETTPAFLKAVSEYETWLGSISSRYTSDEDSDLQDPYHKLVRGVPLQRSEFVEGLNKVIKRLKKNEGQELPEELADFEAYLTYLQDRFGVTREDAERFPLVFPPQNQRGEPLEALSDSGSTKTTDTTLTPERIMEEYSDAIKITAEYKLFAKMYLTPGTWTLTKHDLGNLFFLAQRAQTVDIVQLIWFVGRTFDLRSLELNLPDLLWANLHRLFLGSQAGSVEFESSSTAFAVLQRSVTRAQSEELAAYLTDILVNSSTYSNGLTNLALNAAFLSKLFRYSSNPDL